MNGNDRIGRRQAVWMLLLGGVAFGLGGACSKPVTASQVEVTYYYLPG